MHDNNNDNVSINIYKFLKFTPNKTKICLYFYLFNNLFVNFLLFILFSPIPPLFGFCPLLYFVFVLLAFGVFFNIISFNGSLFF